MPTIIRKKSKPYKWVVGHVALSEVANVEKKLPRDYITEDGFGITEKCRDYLQPLIEGEDYPPYKNGLPGLREDQGRGGEEEAEYRVQALKVWGQARRLSLPPPENWRRACTCSIRNCDASRNSRTLAAIAPRL